MTDISNWTYVYKISREQLCSTNLLYTPMINPEQNVMCMLWDHTHPYQKDNARLTSELIDFFFEREVKHLHIFQDRSWAPKIHDIDMSNKKIFIEFNKESVNKIVHDPGRSLDNECPDWQDQIFTIVADIVRSGYYKMALYPHCFFISDLGKLKTIDFYSCLSSAERYLERNKIAGMIGPESVPRFDAVTHNGLIDFETFFKNTLRNDLHTSWPINPFAGFYSRLFPEIL